VTSDGAALAWQHDHPLYILAISTAFSLVIISLIVLLRWLFSRSAWPYHPGGASGFLKDEFVRLGAIFLPWLVLGLIFKFYVYELHPELNTPRTWSAFGISALVIRLVLRRMPFIKAMGRHLDAARQKAREARRAAPAPAP
jgi:hypothetical protein